MFKNVEVVPSLPRDGVTSPEQAAQMARYIASWNYSYSVKPMDEVSKLWRELIEHPEFMGPTYDCRGGLVTLEDSCQILAIGESPEIATLQKSAGEVESKYKKNSDNKRLYLEPTKCTGEQNKILLAKRGIAQLSFLGVGLMADAGVGSSGVMDPLFNTSSVLAGLIGFCCWHSKNQSSWKKQQTKQLADYLKTIKEDYNSQAVKVRGQYDFSRVDLEKATSECNVGWLRKVHIMTWRTQEGNEFDFAGGDDVTGLGIGSQLNDKDGYQYQWSPVSSAINLQGLYKDVFKTDNDPEDLWYSTMQEPATAIADLQDKVDSKQAMLDNAKDRLEYTGVAIAGEIDKLQSDITGLDQQIKGKILEMLPKLSQHYVEQTKKAELEARFKEYEKIMMSVAKNPASPDSHCSETLQIFSDILTGVGAKVDVADPDHMALLSRSAEYIHGMPNYLTDPAQAKQFYLGWIKFIGDDGGAQLELPSWDEVADKFLGAEIWSSTGEKLGLPLGKQDSGT